MFQPQMSPGPTDVSTRCWRRSSPLLIDDVLPPNAAVRAGV